MYRIYRSFLLTAFAFIAIAVMQAGCKKKDVYPGQTLPSITSVSPAKGIIGSQVVIKGTNLKNVTDVKFGTKDAANFSSSSISDTAITVNVPDSLVPGNLYVQVYYGDGKGYNASSFTVLKTPPVPHITSIAPLTAYPGDQVTIKGINMDIASGVKFGDIAATGVTIVDSTKLQVNVPANATGGEQIVTVESVNGNDTVSFNVNLAPVITSVSPIDKVHEGDVITVKGVRFTGTTSVLLGALETSFTVVDDGTITFPVPTGAITGNVVVKTPKGTGTSTDKVVISVAGFKVIIYDNSSATGANTPLGAGFLAWGGWGGTADYANTEQVESGTSSIKIDYTGQWSSPMQVGGGSVALAGYTTFKISIYGGPGTGGHKFNIGFNSADDPTNYNTSDGKTITIQEGKWTDFEIPIADIISSTGITKLDQFILKEYNGDASFSEIVIYVDNIGLN